MAYTTIDDPSAHFQVDLYTGSGSAKTFDGNSDLQLDMVWIKARSTAENARIADTSRGVGDGTDETRWLIPQDAGTEESSTEFSSIGSDSFTLNTSDAKLNSSSHTYVAWAWKANGGTRTTNTESGNNPAGGYQANTTAGFSIVDYTGTGATGTMAHGLGAVPDFYMIKNRTEAVDWMGYHVGTATDPETDGIRWNTTDAITDAATFWNDTAPTSTVFTVNTSSNVNKDAITYIAYCWKSIQGYSKFGSYTGNGNADGTFVYTGFRPALVIQKRIDTTGNWILTDTGRSPDNESHETLYSNIPNAEEGMGKDLLSNGFKCRTDDATINASGGTYIYAAFAEQPFVTSGGVPATAR